MRIGILTSFLALTPSADSGIGLHYRILADALAEQGHRVHVVHPTLDPDAALAALAALSPRWTCDIVPVRSPHWLDQRLLHSWPSRVLLSSLSIAVAADRAMAKAVQRHSLEIIETHATGTPALVYLQRLRRPPVLTRVSTTQSQMNTASDIRSRIKDWQVGIERFAVRASDTLVTHARNHRDAICALDGYNPRNFALVPHGLPDIAPGGVSAPPAADEAPEVLFVGRFEHRKGIDVLLDAIPAVHAACPQARFTLAGSTGDGVHWNAFTRRHPSLAKERVTALGRVSNEQLEALYARCSLLVAPSRYESFGLVYVEAMRHAKPVIGCNAGGIPDVVDHDVTGLLVPPDDVAGLTGALVRLLRDPSLRTRLGTAGRNAFTRRFSAAGMAAASVRLYDSVCSGESGTLV